VLFCPFISFPDPVLREEIRTRNTVLYVNQACFMYRSVFIFVPGTVYRCNKYYYQHVVRILPVYKALPCISPCRANIFGRLRVLFFGISLSEGEGYELFSKFIQDMDYSELFGTPLT
jgi:hypothetical protein